MIYALHTHTKINVPCEECECGMSNKTMLVNLGKKHITSREIEQESGTLMQVLGMKETHCCGGGQAEQHCADCAHLASCLYFTADQFLASGWPQ